MTALLTHLFVYGSLLRGEPNHRLLEHAVFVGPARTRPSFTLFSLGPYPAMVAEGSTAIVGEIFDVDPPTLLRLDRLEGVPRFYDRVQVALEDGREVDAYVLRPHQVAGRSFIPSGDWRMRAREEPA
jgi:gamma-glutamylcyclotransferase (GGCT)/AIG2-like uncharacterized protein YtfP